VAPVPVPPGHRPDGGHISLTGCAPQLSRRFAELAVVPQLGETAAGWEAFRDAVVADFDPSGPVEAALAGRAAHLLWRLQRVAAIDTAAGAVAAELPPDPAAITGEGVADPVAQLPADAPDARRLARVRALLRNTRRALADLTAAAELIRRPAGDADGVVGEWVVNSVFEAVGMAAGWEWPSSGRVAELRTRLGLPAEAYGPGDWTVGQSHAGLAVVADGLGVAVETFTAAVLESLEALRAESERLLLDREAEESEVAGRMAAARCRALAARALPAERVLDKVIRQEGHLGRQLDLTLRQLERLKSARRPGGAAASLWGSG
jgi:hypothetical protein